MSSFFVEFKKVFQEQEQEQQEQQQQQISRSWDRVSEASRSKSIQNNHHWLILKINFRSHFFPYLESFLHERRLYYKLLPLEAKLILF